jgi:hypothetical protein
MGATSGSAAGITPGTGLRVTVGIFGESVVEGRTLRDPDREGLRPQIALRLALLGFAPGGPGMRPATRPDWSFSRGWRIQGTGFAPGGAGAAGYSAQSSDSSDLATAAVTAPEAVLLYTTSATPTPFAVAAGGRRWSLDAQAPGPRRPARAVLELPAGARSLTVRGPVRGTLTLGGLIDRRPVAGSRPQIEVSNLGHGGHLPFSDPGLALSAVAAERYDVSVFLWSYLAEVLTGPAGAPDDIGPLYASSLAERARIARRHGGRCLVVAPTPFAVATAERKRFATIDRAVARRAGCEYTTALTRLWGSPARAEQAGLIQADQLHPTARGDRLIARALAPIVARLARR